MRRNENDEEHEQNTESNAENHHYLRRWFEAEVVEERHDHDDGECDDVQRHRREESARICDEYKRIYALSDHFLTDKTKTGCERDGRQANFSRPDEGAARHLEG